MHTLTTTRAMALQKSKRARINSISSSVAESDAVGDVGASASASSPHIVLLGDDDAAAAHEGSADAIMEDTTAGAEVAASDGDRIDAAINDTTTDVATAVTSTSNAAAADGGSVDAVENGVATDVGSALVTETSDVLVASTA